jgi:hypothetical protein
MVGRTSIYQDGFFLFYIFEKSGLPVGHAVYERPIKVKKLVSAFHDPS